MYWQIPAVTFIDSDLPADPCEDVSYLDYVSDESFDSLALQLADIFLRMIKGEASDDEIDQLEEASVLKDISHMPARVKCAVLGWRTLNEMFKNGNAIYNAFVTALLEHQTEKMSDILTEIAYSSMSYFDTGKQPSDRVPENFYHGLVLGLIVSLRDRYHIRSNRESGRGRYDIAMFPINKEDDAFIMEFKIHDSRNEKSLAATAENALLQIEEKAYETDLLAAGIPEEKIYKIGFAFSGKDIWVIERK